MAISFFSVLRVVEVVDCGDPSFLWLAEDKHLPFFSHNRRGSFCIYSLLCMGCVQTIDVILHLIQGATVLANYCGYVSFRVERWTIPSKHPFACLEIYCWVDDLPLWTMMLASYSLKSLASSEEIHCHDNDTWQWLGVLRCQTSPIGGFRCRPRQKHHHSRMASMA